MEFLTPMETPLQVELNRIEAEAARQSAMICAAATKWETAHLLCAALNAQADLNPGSLFIRPLEPSVLYHLSDEAEICIYAQNNGQQVLLIAQMAGIPLENRGRAFEGADGFECPDYPGVMIYIRTQYIEAFEKQRLMEAA